MDNLAPETNQLTDAGGVTVAYRGASAQAEAEILHHQLQTSGLAVEPVSEVKQEGGRLGAAEIIITVVVTTAAKAMIITALNYLEEYLRECVEKKRSDANLRVEIKKKAADGKWFPLSLRKASLETVIAFSESLRKAVSDL